MTYQEMHDEKAEVIQKAANLEATPRVPVLSMAQTWAVAYAGEETEKLLDAGPEKEFEAYAKHLHDFYFDGVILFGMNRPIRAYETLGWSPFFISGDKISIQAYDYSSLPEDEIQEYIADPFAFIRDKMLPRRFPNLRKPFPQNMEALGASAQKLMAFVEKNGQAPGYLRDNVGVPLVAADLVEPAFDRYIGYRGWKDGMIDLRAREDEVLEALEATYPVVAPAPGPRTPFPWAFFPITSVTYLNRKNFEKFFWPTFKRSADAIIDAGGKVLIAMEGNWAHVYDMLLDFPKGSIVAFVENDDFIQTKKDIGSKVSLVGGLDTLLLRNGTIDENIDAVKKVLDGCGNEGIMLCTGKALLSPGDVNPDNMRAVNEFIRDYTF